jgi:hypothetical protein
VDPVEKKPLFHLFPGSTSSPWRLWVAISDTSVSKS